MDFYVYLLKGEIRRINNINKDVSEDSYFYVMNARGVEKGFDGKILFEEKIIHYTTKTNYLEDEIQNMIDTINSKAIPESSFNCINCAYSKRRSKFDREE